MFGLAPARYWGPSLVARELGATANLLNKWIKRYSDTAKPFPEPDVVIEEEGGRVTRGWSAESMPAIRQWYAVDRHTVRLPGNPNPGPRRRRADS